MKVFVVTLLLILHAHPIFPRCSDYKDCYSCTDHQSWQRGYCRWCPLDRTCHFKLSLTNDCLLRQNIRDFNQCSSWRDQKYSYKAEDAYRFALLSAIAYSDVPEKCMQAIFPEGDYIVSKVVKVRCDDFLFEYEKMCMAVVAYSYKHKEIVIAFRGTRGTKQIVDQAVTIVATPTVPSPIGGEVQRYFINAHRKMYHHLKYEIQDLTQWFPNYKVKVTGHSLGGAVGSITSANLVKDKTVSKDNVSLYTYGMPRVGNKQYALAHDNMVPSSWRVVRQGDMVPMLPICHLKPCSLFNGPYHHRTKVLYYGTNMSKNSEYVLCRGNEDSNSDCGHQARKRRGAVRYMIDRHKNYFGIPIGTYCRDHVLKDL